MVKLTGMKRFSLLVYVGLVLLTHLFGVRRDLFHNVRQELDRPIRSASRANCTDFFRYRNIRYQKDKNASNEFLLKALNDGCQVIVGRVAGSETKLMRYAELPADTMDPIPREYKNPGFYFTSEMTFEE